MKTLNVSELKNINGGNAWDSVKGGLSDMRQGFSDGLNDWEGDTNKNGWTGRVAGKVAGGVRSFADGLANG
ncbi:bacteriocin [Staphylococcus rostri]|uniref:Bacteriocin n=1 Tax=Staphylococcus rostri TaxID=522262 RepID=A0A2K3YKX3_9STAP|nr:bacteriocin [Staphylococcus rostri]MDO5376461.1 bacteriocin [Staphylococcus rostri]PNZ26259.1 hypothetical protein CD122_08665 [Staphylococcus rostri]